MCPRPSALVGALPRGGCCGLHGVITTCMTCMRIHMCKTKSVSTTTSAAAEHLDEVELEDPQLLANGLGDIKHVVAVGGNNVPVHEVAGDGGLGGDELSLRVPAAAREDDGLDRHVQPPPLACTESRGSPPVQMWKPAAYRSCGEREAPVRHRWCVRSFFAKGELAVADTMHETNAWLAPWYTVPKPPRPMTP